MILGRIKHFVKSRLEAKKRRLIMASLEWRTFNKRLNSLEDSLTQPSWVMLRIAHLEGQQCLKQKTQELTQANYEAILMLQQDVALLQQAMSSQHKLKPKKVSKKKKVARKRK